MYQIIVTVNQSLIIIDIINFSVRKPYDDQVEER